MRMPLPLLSILVISLYIAACNSLQTIDPISMQSEADSYITDSISGEVNPDTLSEQATIDSASCHKKMDSGMMDSGMMDSPVPIDTQITDMSIMPGDEHLSHH